MLPQMIYYHLNIKLLEKQNIQVSLLIPFGINT